MYGEKIILISQPSYVILPPVRHSPDLTSFWSLLLWNLQSQEAGMTAL